MGIYGISQLVIFGGILLLLHIGAADRSSSTSHIDDVHHGASAISSSTHLLYKETQSSKAALVSETGFSKSDRDRTIILDDSRLNSVKEALSSKHEDRTVNSHDVAATAQVVPEELLQLQDGGGTQAKTAEHVTLSTSVLREHVTETDIGAEFGTTPGDETLTEIDASAQFRTTTTSDSLTEMDPRHTLPTTTSATDILTQARTTPSAAHTTEQSDVATVSGATAAATNAAPLAALTEAALKSGTTPSTLEHAVTEREDDAVKVTTVSPRKGADNVITVATSTDGEALVNDRLLSHITVAMVEQVTKDTIDGDLTETGTSPDGLKVTVMPSSESDAATVSEAPELDTIPPALLVVTEGPTVSDDEGRVMPTAAQSVVTTAPNVNDNAFSVGSNDDDATTASNDRLASVISMTTVAATTESTTTVEAEVDPVTERRRGDIAETLEERESGFFRCLDGTMIDIGSFCDGKADCPDFSDEDMCDPEEKANEIQQTRRPSSDWDDNTPTIPSDADSMALTYHPSLVEEIEQSFTEEVLTFTCATGGTVISINAVCDKRADCEDYSDEYDCDGSKHVTEAPVLELPFKPFEFKPRPEKSLAIEILEEAEEETELFRCLDGGAAIPMTAVCDKKWDCFDFSDEDECDDKGKLNISKSSKTKPSMSWATSIPVPDIPDNGKMTIIEEISDAKGSLPEFWRCENGNFIFISSVCDKKDDCGDFSDEDDCLGNRKVPTTEAPPITRATTTMATAANNSESGTVAVTEPMSTTVQSSPASLTLFPNSDIKLVSSELVPSLDILVEEEFSVDKYPVAMFTCEDGEEIEAVRVCDHEVDCFDGSDEDDCYDGWYNEPRMRFAREVGSGTGPTSTDVGTTTNTYTTVTPCGTGFFMCDDNSCIDEALVCNGINNCMAGEDESDTYCADACPFPSLNDRVVLASTSTGQSKYQNGAVLDLDCIIGSTLIGSSSVTCENGTFTSGPNCYRNCHIDTSKSALTCTTDVYMHGVNPNCTCDSGYELETPNADITCNDTLFLPSHPQCREINECLLTVSPCDTNAACSNMPLGSFMCTCNAGYNGTGLVCADVDECTVGTDNCDADATCTNTAGSYTCACNTGYFGDGVLSCVLPIYFPYGTANNDSSISATPGGSVVEGYSVSGPLQRRTLFPFGDSLYRYIHITNSGIVAFSNVLSVDLSEFSHPTNFNSTSAGDVLPAIAIFGISAATSATDSNVFYQIYEETDFNDITLLDEVSAIVNDADISLNTFFIAKWAMIITWENLRRFGVADTSTETNTFQAVLATDGVQGVSLLYFQEDDFQFDADQLPTDQLPIIGYRTPAGFFDLMSTEGYTRAQMFRPDQLVGNIFLAGTTGRRKRSTTYELGRFVYRLDEHAEDYVNAADYCQSWYDNDYGYTKDHPGVLPCPCTRIQAQNDRRFRTCASYPSGTGLPVVDPYPDRLKNSDECVQQVFPGQSQVGSRCVYFRNESLAVGYNTLWESSHIQSFLVTSRSTRSFQYTTWAQNDVLPRYYCCSQSSDSYFCNLYETKRPRRSCNNYYPVGQGWGIGDPHITTLDTFQYTFNGLGEYTLIRINSTGFELQARTEKAIDKDGLLADSGTVFTAFAAEYGSTKIEFILHSDRTNMTILANGTDLIDPAILKTDDFVSTDANFDLRFVGTGSQSTGDRYMAIWREGVNDFSVTVGFQINMLDFSFQAPTSYQDGRTTGIYGIWNGDVGDDIVSPDGSIHPTPFNLTEEQLFDLGELWRVDESTTLFTYLVDNTWTTFNSANFTPLFLADLIASADPTFLSFAQANCTTDNDCLFDALATKDLSVGTNTMMTSQTREQEVLDLGNYPPFLSNITELNENPNYPGLDADGVLTLIVGRSYMFQALAEDPNGDVVEFSLQGNVPPNATIDPLTGILTYSPSDVTTAVSMGILASDGLVSRFLQLQIILCDCQNNGTCDFTSTQEGNDLNNDKFAVAQCECDTGWAGTYCASDYDSCQLNPCYPGVTCIDLPAPSLNPTCSSCPPTTTGDGFQCWDLDECAQNTDGCAQICTNTIGFFACSCNSGYELQPDQKNCIDIDECDRGTDQCDTNAACNNTVGSYECTCNTGFMLDPVDNTTCDDTDECSTIMPCDANADCANSVGSYTCTCLSGYQGTGKACEDINECFNPDLSNCSPFATCTNLEGYFVCDCDAGYQGSGLNCTDRNECEEGISGCSANAGCTNLPGSYMCNCNPGYQGDGSTCVDIDECSDSSLNDCDVNAVCTNTLGSYTCACNSGYLGNGTSCADVDECLASPGPCSVYATCTNNEGSYICTCDSGWMGDGLTCSDINECALEIDDCSQKCQNKEPGYSCACNAGFQLTSDNSTCEVAPGMLCDAGLDPCTGQASCLNATGLITCSCARGYNLTNETHCEDIDECADMTDNCDSSVGVCTNIPGAYMCSCQDGYQLGSDQRSCSDINECETGANNCSANAACTNVPGGFSCGCNTGYSGDGMVCSDINECDTLPCVANSDCTNTDGSYTCACSSGYVGNQALGCMDLNECLSSMPCGTNADCTNTLGSYNCSCQSGYYGNGTYCQDVKECDTPDICPANSNCRELEGSYTCVCRSSGYRGDGTTDCIDIDECAENLDNCDSSNGLCTNTDGNYTCSCNTGFVGDGTTCSDMDECSLGLADCDVNAYCNNTFGSFTCTCRSGYFNAAGGRASVGSCADVDECALLVDECGPNADCENTNGSYVCNCKSGFMQDAEFTCIDIPECAGNPCSTALLLVCNELEGSYECVCQSSTTLVNGTCRVATTLFLTVPFVGVGGLQVEYYFSTINTPEYLSYLVNVTEAVLLTSPLFADLFSITVEEITLRSNGIVADITFRVDIPFTTTIMESQLTEAFMTGVSNGVLGTDNVLYIDTGVTVDVNECSNMTICPLNSMCMNTIGSYICNCDSGYGYADNTTAACTDVDECSLGICDVNSACTNNVGSYVCDCNTGYSGTGLVCNDVDECVDANDCGANADCSNTQGSYVCSCQTGYSGSPPTDTCQDIDECLIANVCGDNADCTNTDGSFTCVCESGYTGSPPGTTCTDINECDVANDCGSNADCTNTDGSYSCACQFGYTGLPPSIPCIDSDNATCPIDNTCENNSTCIFDESAGVQYCLCRPGYAGPLCERDIACPGHICLNGGVCLVDASGNPYCSCPTNYTGESCQDLVACIVLGCLNNSTCELDENGNVYCNCLEGWTGTRCEEEVSSGLAVGAIVGIVLGSVAVVLLIVLAIFCCWAVVAARHRRQLKMSMFEAEENRGYDNRRRFYAPASRFAPGPSPAPGVSVSGLSRGAVVRNDPAVLTDSSSDNFYDYRNTRGQFGAAAAASAPPRRDDLGFLDDDDDDDTIDSRFSGIIKNMWNMHADQRPPTTFDPRELPTTSNFLASGGIPRASVQARNLFAEYEQPRGFEVPYVADGTESNAYSEETEEFRPYRGRTGREKTNRGFEPYNYF